MTEHEQLKRRVARLEALLLRIPGVDPNAVRRPVPQTSRTQLTCCHSFSSPSLTAKANEVTSLIVIRTLKMPRWCSKSLVSAVQRAKKSNANTDCVPYQLWAKICIASGALATPLSVHQIPPICFPDSHLALSSLTLRPQILSLALDRSQDCTTQHSRPL